VGGAKPQPGREVGGWLKKLVHVNGGPEARGVRKNARQPSAQDSSCPGGRAGFRTGVGGKGSAARPDGG